MMISTQAIQATDFTDEFEGLWDSLEWAIHKQL